MPSYRGNNWRFQSIEISGGRVASSASKARLRGLALTAFLIGFAVVFFRLPYYFPVSPLVSASYIFQYNNRVAVLIFLAGAAAFAILFRGLSLEPATKDSRVSRISALIAIALCVALGLLFYGISSPDGLHGEAAYFYGRLSQLAAGRTIYRDFEFAYGPLLLYLPFWTVKLIHLSLIEGYILFWLVDWAIGIWILYRLVNAIEIPSPYRTVIFFLFVLDFTQALWQMGINYAPIRTLLSGGLAMLVFAAHKRRYPPAIVAGVSVLCALLVAAVSPEHGIAFMLGTGLFFGLCVRERPVGFWPSIAAMGLCFLAIFALSERMGVYTTLHAFSSGGYNYPILPYPGLLCVMGLYLVAACVAYLAWRRKQIDSLTIYLLCICMFGLPACFGRADSGHMQIGAFSALIIAALALSRYPRVLFLVAVAFLYWDATPQFPDQYGPVREAIERRIFDPSQHSALPYRSTVLILHLLHRDAHKDSIESKVEQYYSGKTAIPDLPNGIIVNAPLGFMRNAYVDTSGKVDYGYFFILTDVILPSQVDSIVRWLEVHPERSLILSRDWPKGCYSFMDANDPSFRTWYGFHWASPKRRMQVVFPLCDFILSHYAQDEIPFSYDARLWHPIVTARTSGATFTPAARPSLTGAYFDDPADGDATIREHPPTHSR